MPPLRSTSNLLKLQICRTNHPHFPSELALFSPEATHTILSDWEDYGQTVESPSGGRILVSITKKRSASVGQFQGLRCRSPLQETARTSSRECSGSERLPEGFPKLTGQSRAKRHQSCQRRKNP